MGPADSDRITRVPPYSGYRTAGQRSQVRGYHPLRLNFPVDSSYIDMPSSGPTTPTLPRQRRFGLLPFRSPLLRESIFLYFPPGTEMFQFSGLAPIAGWHLEGAGLPHSDTHGSSPVCGSPWFFAAYRVLRRLQKPRHPPFALNYFLYSYSNYFVA